MTVCQASDASSAAFFWLAKSILAASRAESASLLAVPSASALDAASRARTLFQISSVLFCTFWVEVS